MWRYRVVSATDWGRCSLVADDDVAVLGTLCDDGELAAWRRRLNVGEAHQRQVDALAGLRHDHPRAGHRRADSESPRRVASNDARLAAGDRIDVGICGSEKSATVHRTAAAAVATARDVGGYKHYIHTTRTFLCQLLVMLCIACFGQPLLHVLSRKLQSHHLRPRILNQGRPCTPTFM